MSLVPKHIKNLMPYKAGKPISEVQRELNLNHIVKLSNCKILKVFISILITSL